MEKIEVRHNTQSADATAAAGKFSKSQFLRLDKQTIRTLTGAELKLAGGGMHCTCCSCTCHSNQAV